MFNNKRNKKQGNKFPRKNKDVKGKQYKRKQRGRFTEFFLK